MKLEILERDKYYHIYNRGINGTSIFKSDKNKVFFLKKLKQHLHQKINVYAYCLLSNHFHLVCEIIEEPEIVSQSFSNFFNSYAKAFNKEQNRTGSLFDKHFKRIALDKEIYLKQLIIYIHLNPFLHFKQDYSQYKFSSYSSILSTKRTNLPRKEILNLFDGIQNFKAVHKNRSTVVAEEFTLE